jgi:N-acetylneuraminic acid mutarotase
VACIGIAAAPTAAESTPSMRVAPGGVSFPSAGRTVSQQSHHPAPIEPEALPAIVDAWGTATSMPTARFATATTTLGGFIYVFGGCADRACDVVLNTAEAYNPTVDKWNTAYSPMPTPRGVGGGAVGKDAHGTLRIYVIGGRDASPGAGNSLSANEAYDPIADKWTTEAPLPVPVYGSGVATGSDGRIYVLGGYNSATNANVQTVQVYDPATNAWTNKADLPAAVYWPGSVARGNTIYVMGGLDDAGNNLSSVYAYDIPSSTWSTRAPLPSGRCCLGAVASTNGLIFAMGGWNGDDGSDLNINEVYNPSTNHWGTRSPMPTARDGFGLARGPNGKFYAIGGELWLNFIVYAVNEVYTP